MEPLEKQQGKIAVIGLGFVGLPLSMKLVEKGFNVIGIDVDTKKVQQLNKGLSHIPDISDRHVKEAINTNKFLVSSEYKYISQAEAVLICVPTPLTKYKTPDLSYVMEASGEISKYLQKNQLIVLESSTYPGTTREVVLPLLNKSGLEIEKDFNLAYSPERIDPGTKIGIDEIPKIVSGISKTCVNRIKGLYRKIYKNVIAVSSPETAEMTKLLENSFRFVNISFINEFAVICDHLEIDVWEVIDAASTKPYGFTPFYPGPGIGGHCIPIDPLFLEWKISNHHMSSFFIQLANKVNEETPHYIIKRLQEVLTPKKELSQSKILLYGLSYKKNINDIRESKAVDVFKLLNETGAKISYHDPFVPFVTINNKVYNSIALTPESLKNYDCVVILTDHTSLPADLILEYASVVFDTRNAIGSKKGSANVIKLGGGKNKGS